MKPDIRPDSGYKKRPDIRYNPIMMSSVWGWLYMKPKYITNDWSAETLGWERIIMRKKYTKLYFDKKNYEHSPNYLIKYCISLNPFFFGKNKKKEKYFFIQIYLCYRLASVLQGRNGSNILSYEYKDRETIPFKVSLNGFRSVSSSIINFIHT